MPKQLFIFLAILVLGFNFHPPIAQAQGERQAIETMFQYMQAGNTDGILSIITDPMLSAKKSLFQKKSYSAFLKKHYKNAELLIDKIESVGTGKSRIDIRIDFNDGGPLLRTRFIVIQDNGIWKISNEISDSF